jgi:hypothetical protein
MTMTSSNGNGNGNGHHHSADAAQWPALTWGTGTNYLVIETLPPVYIVNGKEHRGDSRDDMNDGHEAGLKYWADKELDTPPPH